jgi:16S rRNA (cytidine1402-2'-O)-methyltransferase
MSASVQDRQQQDTDASSRVLERAQSVLAEQLAQKLPPGLYLVATPIGNLGDISLRALSVLARADLIAAEDTRHSRKLLSHFAIKAELTPYHEHNAAKERPRLWSPMQVRRSSPTLATSSCARPWMQASL